MEITQKAVAVRVLENGVLETECPIDGDFMLPDYCPDIAAVLKCTLTPAVLSRRQNGDKLLVEGQACLRVLYVDDERKKLQCFEGVLPFGCSIACRDVASMLPYVQMRLNYLNCHAVSSRRIDVHGALTAVCHSDTLQQMQVLCELNGEGVHTRTASVCCAVPLGVAEKNFTISETVEIDSNKPVPERVLRTACCPMITSVKQLTDKAIVKGDVQVVTLYATEDGITCQTQQTFPFSQILELEGLDESHLCTVHTDVIACDVQVASEEAGMGRSFAVAVKLCLRMRAVSNVTTPVLTDAYTSKYPVKTTCKQLTAEELLFTKQHTSTLKEVLDLPGEDVAEILDLWCDVIAVNVRQEAENTYADGRLQICMPVRDREGRITYYEHTGDFTLQFEEACDRMTVDVKVCDTDYAVVGGKIEICMQLSVSREGYAQKICDMLQQFEVSGDPYPEEQAALRLCRVQKGASLWELAKAHHTDMQALMEENCLDCECVQQDCMLTVPLC